MNKTKKVAWHKHLKKAKKRAEKLHAEAERPATPTTTGPATRTTTRRPSTSTPRS